MRRMEPLLYLVHRIPFPPNKGDKIRSYHLLRHLARRFAVHTGHVCHMPEDEAHVHRLESMCASHRVETIDPRLARLRSVSGFLTGEALTLPYYRNSALAQPGSAAPSAQYGIRKAVVFSAAMAQYVQDLTASAIRARPGGRRLGQMGRNTPSATAGQRLTSIGVRAKSCSSSSAARPTERAAANVFVTRGEADIFRRRVPGFERQVHVIENGVNTDYFAPHAERKSPYAANEAPIVFHRGDGLLAERRRSHLVRFSEVLPAVLAERPRCALLRRWDESRALR